MRCHCASVNSRRIKIAPLSRDLESHPRVGGNPLGKCQQDLVFCSHQRIPKSA
jgi:hypothetical protein